MCPHINTLMYSEVHTAIGWLIAQPVKADRRFRIQVTLAGLLPDLDAATYLLGSNWYSRYHHVWTHNLFFGLGFSILASFISSRHRTKTFLFTQLAFWLHILSDYFFSKMPIALCWPLSDKMYGSPSAFPLWHPINHMFVWLSLALVLLITFIYKRSPLELIHPNFDQRFVKFFLSKRTHTCARCDASTNEVCQQCGESICSKHAVITKDLSLLCD